MVSLFSFIRLSLHFGPSSKSREKKQVKCRAGGGAMYMCGVGGMHMWGGGRRAGAVLCSRLIRHVTSRTYIAERLGKFHEKRIC